MAKIDKRRIGEYLKTALRILDENGGQLPSKSVINELSKKLNLTAYEKETLEKSGYIRWESVVHFYSIDVSKAGWLRKKGGIWYLTPEGKEALKLEPLAFIEAANEKYKEWKKAQDATESSGSITGESSNRENSVVYEKALSDAKEELRQFIMDKNPYDFQDMVAALLRGMGYYTPFVAPKGKDGGLDIRAYKDPLGAEEPRIKVQVKHRAQQKAANQEINQLIGILKDGDVGLFVSTSGFTPDANNVIRTSHKHIESIDLDGFIGLWEEYYTKLSDDDRRLMPLKNLSFLAPEE